MLLPQAKVFLHRYLLCTPTLPPVTVFLSPAVSTPAYPHLHLRLHSEGPSSTFLDSIVSFIHFSIDTLHIHTASLATSTSSPSLQLASHPFLSFFYLSTFLSASPVTQHHVCSPRKDLKIVGPCAHVFYELLFCS
ncbi:hypothetical protein BS47DRAFT_604260 [Hydnum rufescens UP504]|uniref:Uncharacterized protein n=1 Tax=Hydnum rufescens UP504 TaxID=1448309 RepID=A0A9P6B3G7_9AGAM|nr:hypothetical protein BS47DRAFT_604260 [Hydnum rufescens UP504]